MNPDQVQLLLQHLGKIADNIAGRPYTITQAADWPILVVVGGGLVALIAVMWHDLKGTMRDGKEEMKGIRAEWKGDLLQHKEENEKSLDLLWQAHRDCQADCCPRKKE